MSTCTHLCLIVLKCMLSYFYSFCLGIILTLLFSNFFALLHQTKEFYCLNSSSIFSTITRLSSLKYQNHGVKIICGRKKTHRDKANNTISLKSVGQKFSSHSLFKHCSSIRFRVPDNNQMMKVSSEYHLLKILNLQLLCIAGNLFHYLCVVIGYINQNTYLKSNACRSTIATFFPNHLMVFAL